MPRLSVWFVRASLLYLLAGTTLGALILAEKGIPRYPAVWLAFPIHVEFLLIGWLVQLAMGVAYWILPRHGRVAPRGNESLVWAGFILVNAGIWLAVAQLWMPSLLVVGRLSELGGVVVYVAGTWRRVKPMVVESLK